MHAVPRGAEGGRERRMPKQVLASRGRTWRTPHQETKSRMMGAKKITEATSGMGRTPGNSARQPFSSGRYGAPGRSQG